MASGTTLDEILWGFRVREKFDYEDSAAALCRMAARAMDARCANVIINGVSQEGGSYARLTLADLELLGDIPDVSGVDEFTQSHRHEAIIERKPYLLYARAQDPGWEGTVALYKTDVPLEAPLGKPTSRLSGALATFEFFCDNVRRSAAAWPSELCILRDEPDLVLLRFLRAPSAHAA
jgi:hypothetical protein